MFFEYYSMSFIVSSYAQGLAVFPSHMQNISAYPSSFCVLSYFQGPCSQTASATINTPVGFWRNTSLYWSVAFKAGYKAFISSVCDILYNDSWPNFEFYGTSTVEFCTQVSFSEQNKLHVKTVMNFLAIKVYFWQQNKHLQKLSLKRRCAPFRPWFLSKFLPDVFPHHRHHRVAH